MPPGSRVLDLGTADGSVARALKKRGCTVWGIEQDEQAAKAASQVCDRVIVADLEAKEAFEPLGSETFDVVLALDVLEHLRDPAPVLKCAASYLTPGGIAVVSIPNVTHGALRLSLLEGRFNYTEQGLLDRTHLRFFDRHAAEQLISEAGLTISQHLRVRRELEETEIAVSKDGLPIEASAKPRIRSGCDDLSVRVRGWTNEWLGHKHIRAAMLSERLLAENEGLRAQLKELASTQRIWKPISQPDWTALQKNSKSVRMSSPKRDRCRLARPLNLSRFNESATNYARNSFDGLKRPIRCTGTLDSPGRM